MKMQATKLLMLIFPISVFIFLSAFIPNSEPFTGDHSNVLNADDGLKKEALKILKAKCNVCHRKKNSFMVFNQKNMVRRSSKIYKAVFVKRRMPKGEDISLTNVEYTKLKKWLLTQKINK